MINPISWLIERHILAEFDATDAPKLFAHYTSAQSLKNIITTRSIWLKKTSEMNDISEVKHGVYFIKNFFFKTNQTFWVNLDAIHKGLSTEIEQVYFDWVEDLYSETYITCFTGFNSEKPYGKLSMWRGYGTDKPVALVVNNKFLNATNNPYGLITTPVFYYSENEVRAFFSQFLSFIEKYKRHLHQYPRSDIKEAILNIFKTMTFSFKHEGFSEEKEWRVVYRPNERLKEKLEKPPYNETANCKNFYSLPLTDRSIKLEFILDHILVGPSKFENETFEEINKLVKKNGLLSRPNLVRFSKIPYREN